MRRPTKVIIEFDTKNAAFHDNFMGETMWVVASQAMAKIKTQLERPEALCYAPEDADILRDHNGNAVGKVLMEWEESDLGPDGECPHCGEAHCNCQWDVGI